MQRCSTLSPVSTPPPPPPFLSGVPPRPCHPHSHPRPRLYPVGIHGEKTEAERNVMLGVGDKVRVWSCAVVSWGAHNTKKGAIWADFGCWSPLLEAFQGKALGAFRPEWVQTAEKRTLTVLWVIFQSARPVT